MIREGAARTAGVRHESPAYRSGWEDGRFGSFETFGANATLASWEGVRDRLAYYRGHRDGRRVREMLGIDASRA